MVLQLQEIEMTQLYSAPTQRNDDIDLVPLTQTTNSFSPKPPLDLAQNINSVATRGVNSHSPIPTTPSEFSICIGRNDQHIRRFPFDSNRWILQNSSRSSRSSSSNNNDNTNGPNTSSQRTSKNPDDRSAHLTKTQQPS